MTIRAQMPDGTVLEFPDGTSDAVVDRVAKQHIASAKKAQPAPVAAQPRPTPAPAPAPRTAPAPQPAAQNEESWMGRAFRAAKETLTDVFAPAFTNTVKTGGNPLTTAGAVQFGSNLLDSAVSNVVGEGTAELVKRNAAQGAAPAAGGWAGFGAGAQVGNRVTAPLRRVPRVGAALNAGGTIVGGLVGAMGGSQIVKRGQDALIDALPTEVTQPLGIDAATREKDMRERPYVTAFSHGAPGFLFGVPGMTRLPVREGATAAERIFANPVTGAVAGGGIAAVAGAGAQYATTGQVDPGMVAVSAALGASQNRNTALGDAFSSLGARLGGAGEAPGPL